MISPNRQEIPLKLNCRKCRGACCESIILDISAYDADEQKWFAFHGRLIDSDHVELETPCIQLQKDGTCGVYDQRPFVCRGYPLGGPGCLRTILRRRQ